MAWAQQGWSIPAGTHLLEWRYEKDISLSAGSDRAWLDQVIFMPYVLSPAATPQLVQLQTTVPARAVKSQ